MKDHKTKLSAADWLPFFLSADVLTKALTEAHSAKAKAIKIGQFLSPNVNRTVPILVNGRSGNATLRVDSKGHAKEKRYFFEVVWDETTAAKKEPEKKSAEKNAKGNHKTTAETTKAKPSTPTTKKSTVKPAKSGNDEEWE